jgi:hypothetical protein
MESKFQANRIKQLEAGGYYVVKLIQTNKNGIPDVICLHPEKGVKFIEFKAAKGVLRELQKYRIKEIFEKTGIITEIEYEPIKN